MLIERASELEERIRARGDSFRSAARPRKPEVEVAKDSPGFFKACWRKLRAGTIAALVFLKLRRKKKKTELRLRGIVHAMRHARRQQPILRHVDWSFHLLQAAMSVALPYWWSEHNATAPAVTEIRVSGTGSVPITVHVFDGGTTHLDVGQHVVAETRDAARPDLDASATPTRSDLDAPVTTAVDATVE